MATMTDEPAAGWNSCWVFRTANQDPAPRMAVGTFQGPLGRLLVVVGHPGGQPSDGLRIRGVA